MGQTIAEALFEEGRVAGELRVTRHVVRKLLEARFGTLPEHLIHRIENASDVERLTEAALQVSSLQNLEEFQL